MNQCIHLTKEPNQESTVIKDLKTGESLFALCTRQCLEVWEGDPQPNPLDSQAFHVFRSIDPDLPKDQWLRLTDKPTSQPEFLDRTSMPGAVYYVYAITINAFGLESEPSEVLRIGENDEAVDLSDS